ncbi:MAG TPA: hypothetical protein VMM76_16100 [Pirellulaceae bacterium]|nr:hypothetical protein [Pirellulaceae bacterium]
MDDVSQMESPQITEQQNALPETELDAASQPFVGQWNQLVSTTNWEKGRIILDWREALVEAQAPAIEYSDEAWSRRVGNVTGQHVGRLRRVYERFGSVSEQYDELFWSHFQAALDWKDAEMWLEGAVQNSWSVSQMRRTRWETLGAVEADRPRDEDVVASELDEDVDPSRDSTAKRSNASNSRSDVQSSPLHEGPDFGDEDAPADTQNGSAKSGASIYADDDARETIEFVRPFENLGELPEDLAEAFDAFKLAILRHKQEGWEQISRDDVLASLDALKELALAPSADESPF